MPTYEQDDKMERVAAKIANTIIKGESVRYGVQPFEFFNFTDVYQFICNDDELCVQLADINTGFMYAVENADLAVEYQIKMDELTLEATGLFAESVASQVYNYWQVCNSELLAELVSA